MPVNWDDAKDRQFLLAIIHTTSPGAPNWNQVAELLNASASEGDQYVGNAIRQRFAKMKKDSQAQFGDMPAITEGTGTTPKTPKRGGKKATGETPAKSTGKRKSKKSDSTEDDLKGGDQEDDSESPTKKVKSEPTVGSDEEDELV